MNRIRCHTQNYSSLCRQITGVLSLRQGLRALGIFLLIFSNASHSVAIDCQPGESPVELASIDCTTDPDGGFWPTCVPQAQFEELMPYTFDYFTFDESNVSSEVCNSLSRKTSAMEKELTSIFEIWANLRLRAKCPQGTLRNINILVKARSSSFCEEGDRRERSYYTSAWISEFFASACCVDYGDN